MFQSKVGLLEEALTTFFFTIQPVLSASSLAVTSFRLSLAIWRALDSTIYFDSRFFLFFFFTF